MKSNNNHYDKKKGIIFIIMAAFFFALMTCFARLAGDLPFMQKAFFRNAIAFIFSIAILSRTSEKFHIKKECVPILIPRSIFGLIGILCNYYALDRMAISDANMLNKLSPFFVIIFSYLILKEKASKRQWMCVIIAFIGALFVIKPEFNSGSIPAIIAATGGLCAGIAYTFVRIAGLKGERKEVIVFFFSGFSTIILLPFLILNYTPMTIGQFLILICTGLAAMGGQLSITAAYTYAPAKEISVFDYSQIIFAALLGFVFFDQIPDYLSIIGYVIIIGVAVFNWYNSNKNN